MEAIIDLKDRKILYELDINSRTPNSIIAKRTRLSKDVVNYRIKNLERKGIIKGYYTIVDFSRLGYFSIRVYIKLVDISTSEEKEIIDYLILHKKVLFVARTYGYSDITFGPLVKDIYEFEDFYMKFKERFKKYIGNETIAIYTKVYHFHRVYLLDKNDDTHPPEIFGDGPFVKYDKIDISILRLLANNARIPLIEISKKLKIPTRTIAYRIKQLEKNKIIQGYRFIFDFNQLGYKYYKVDFILKDISRISNLRNYFRKYPNMIYTSSTIGGSDSEIFLEVKNKEHFLEIINDIRDKFPEIREWKYFEFEKYYKLLYFPREL